MSTIKNHVIISKAVIKEYFITWNYGHNMLNKKSGL